MNQNIKNVLWVVVMLTAVAIGYAAISFVHSYGESIQPSSFRSFSVTGQGKAIAIPNVAEFTFTVITQGGKDVSSLQSQNTTAANKVISFVKSDGVADKDIQTQYYNVSPDYQTYSCNNVVVPQSYGASSGGTVSSQTAIACPPASIVGYTVTQTVDVKIRDFTKIGNIMGGVVTNGANQVGQLSFTLDDQSSAQNQAEADAIAKAKAEAEVIAKAGGFTIGRLLNVQTGGNPYPIYNENQGIVPMALSSAKVASTPAIQPGSEEVDMTVTLQYEIQ